MLMQVHTSRFHLICTSSQKFLNLLRFHLFPRPCILPPRLLRRGLCDNVILDILLRRAVLGFEDVVEERHFDTQRLSDSTEESQCAALVVSEQQRAPLLLILLAKSEVDAMLGRALIANMGVLLVCR